MFDLSGNYYCKAEKASDIASEVIPKQISKFLEPKNLDFRVILGTTPTGTG